MSFRNVYIGPVLYLSGKDTIHYYGYACSTCGTPGCKFEKLTVTEDTGLKFCSGCGKQHVFEAMTKRREATFTDFMYDESNPKSKQHIERLRYPNECHFLIPNYHSDTRTVAILDSNDADSEEDEVSFDWPVNVDIDHVIARYKDHYRVLLQDLVEYGFSYRIEIRIVLN